MLEHALGQGILFPQHLTQVSPLWGPGYVPRKVTIRYLVGGGGGYVQNISTNNNNKAEKNKIWCGCGDPGTLCLPLAGNTKRRSCVEDSMSVPPRIKNRIVPGSSNPTCEHHPKELLAGPQRDTCISMVTVASSSRSSVGATPGSMDARMDERNVVSAHGAISFGLKKQAESDTCRNMAEH